jgi:5-methylcytosine-specific restriction endonuclease McrA
VVAGVSRLGSSKRRRKRRALLLRDGAACAYCGLALGTGLPYSRPTLDHVIPVSRGGSNALTNMVLACKPCNRAKADRMPEVTAA